MTLGRVGARLHGRRTRLVHPDHGVASRLELRQQCGRSGAGARADERGQLDRTGGGGAEGADRVTGGL